MSLTILPETADDAPAIERLHERTFGPGRYRQDRLSAARTGARTSRDVSFTARIGTLLVGSVWLSPVRIGETKALLLGPLTVEPAFRERGIGQALIERALKEATAKGHRLVILVGDEPYYGKCGFKRVPPGRAIMPGRSIRRGFSSPNWPRARSIACRGRSGRIGEVLAAFARPGAGETAEQQ